MNKGATSDTKRRYTMKQTTHPGSVAIGAARTTNHSRGGPRSRRLSVNITPAERGGRVVIGSGAVLVGILLLVSAGSVLAVVLEVLLIAAGLDLVITGALGHCPLYQRLEHVPTSLRRPT